LLVAPLIWMFWWYPGPKFSTISNIDYTVNLRSSYVTNSEPFSESTEKISCHRVYIRYIIITSYMYCVAGSYNIREVLFLN
jgi:hypothetical protein